jgi:hypothetical protein
MTRQEALDRIKMIAFDESFKDSITQEYYVLLPPKPASKARTTKKKTRNIREVSPSFYPIPGDAVDDD